MVLVGHNDMSLLFVSDGGKPRVVVSDGIGYGIFDLWLQIF